MFRALFFSARWVFAVVLLASCGGGGASYLTFPLWAAIDVKVADLDGDGRLDVVTLSRVDRYMGDAGQGFVQVRLQTAPGVFTPPQSYPLGNYPWKLVIADIDGDGAPDLIVTNVKGSWPGSSGDSIWMLRQDVARRGTFSAPQRLVDLAESPYKIAVGDLNGDGAPDIVTTASTGRQDSVTLLLQDPSMRGRFLPPVSVALPGMGATNVAIGDLDGDGRNDLVARVELTYSQGYSTTALGVLHGRPDGTLGAWTDLPSPVAGINSPLLSVVDANHDGKMDVLELLCCTDGNAQAVALFQAPDGSFVRSASWLLGLSGLDSEVFADLDGDGRQDLAMAGSYPVGAGPLAAPEIKARVNVIRQDATGAFLPTQATQVPLGDRIAAGDMNGDGLDGLVVFDFKGDTPVLLLLVQSPVNRGTFSLTQQIG